jgi:hypothetical protein
MPLHDSQDRDVSLFPSTNFRRDAARCALILRDRSRQTGRSKQRPYVAVNAGGASSCELSRGMK